MIDSYKREHGFSMAALRRKGILKFERIITRFIVASNIINTQNRLFLQSRL